MKPNLTEEEMADLKAPQDPNPRPWEAYPEFEGTPVPDDVPAIDDPSHREWRQNFYGIERHHLRKRGHEVLDKQTAIALRNANGPEGIAKRVAYLRVPEELPLEEVLEHMAETCGTYALAQGFMDTLEEDNFSSKTALLHSEVSELYEGARSPSPSNKLGERFSQMEEEAADVFLVLMSLCRRYNIDLARAVRAKQLFNAHRSRHRNGKLFG